MWQRQKRPRTANVMVVRMACLEVVSVDSICAEPTSLIICALTLAATLPVFRISGPHLAVPIVIELTFPRRVTDYPLIYFVNCGRNTDISAQCPGFLVFLRADRCISRFVNCSIFG